MVPPVVRVRTRAAARGVLFEVAMRRLRILPAAANCDCRGESEAPGLISKGGSEAGEGKSARPTADAGARRRGKRSGVCGGRVVAVIPRVGFLNLGE